jgi:hypothetical protein
MPPYFASQRTILPEFVGEDERLMSQGNSVIEGGAAFAALIGPALAGVLIPFIGAPNVLYVDAATYAVAFLLVLVFVFVALFVATFFTPLINGPLIAVLTARTPDGLRAMVMTAVISVNTLAAPVGSPRGGAGARALGRRPALRRRRRGHHLDGDRVLGDRPSSSRR